MDVFNLRARLVADYQSYTRSFVKIRDERIEKFVDEALTKGAFGPEPLLQLNPTFLPGGTLMTWFPTRSFTANAPGFFGLRSPILIMSVGSCYCMNTSARPSSRQRKESPTSLTSGTGSGKSLADIVPIVDNLLRNGSGRGIQAIVVYPMNALANSQDEKLGKFLKRGYPEGQSPVRFALGGTQRAALPAQRR